MLRLRRGLGRLEIILRCGCAMMEEDGMKGARAAVDEELLDTRATFFFCKLTSHDGDLAGQAA